MRCCHWSKRSACHFNYKYRAWQLSSWHLRIQWCETIRPEEFPNEEENEIIWEVSVQIEMQCVVISQLWGQLTDTSGGVILMRTVTLTAIKGKPRHDKCLFNCPQAKSTLGQCGAAGSKSCSARGRRAHLSICIDSIGRRQRIVDWWAESLKKPDGQKKGANSNWTCKQEELDVSFSGYN